MLKSTSLQQITCNQEFPEECYVKVLAVLVPFGHLETAVILWRALGRNQLQCTVLKSIDVDRVLPLVVVVSTRRRSRVVLVRNVLGKGLGALMPRHHVAPGKIKLM